MWKNRYLDTEDLIDFPCSATYLGAYAEQGLTRCEVYTEPEDRTLELKAELELARRGVVLMEPVVAPPVRSKYGMGRSIEAQVVDLKRDVNGLKKKVHSHTAKEKAYKDYTVE